MVHFSEQPVLVGVFEFLLFHILENKVMTGFIFLIYYVNDFFPNKNQIYIAEHFVSTIAMSVLYITTALGTRKLINNTTVIY